MRLAIVTVGTRGDVQPLVALGLRLRASGHDVTIVTHDDFEPMVTAHGFAFRRIGGSMKQLVESADGREWLESGDSLRRYMKTMRRIFTPLIETWNSDVLAATDGFDALLAYPFAVGAFHAAELRGVPIVMLPYVPFVPSRELTHIFFPPPPFFCGIYNRLSWEIAMRAFWAPFMQGHQAFRERIGLRRVPQPTLSHWVLDRHTPTVHLYSALLEPRPSDWPSWVEVAGFCHLDTSPDWQPPPRLADFLASGAPPVYVGFGSMTGRDPEELARIAVDAVRGARQRAVMVTGWGGLGEADLGDDVLVLPDAPHDWLFPRCAAVVHHGGAGTTAAGLRAGRPTVVTPFFGDQPYWGRRVAALGAGPRPIQKRALAAPALADAISRAVNDAPMRGRAAELGERLRAEDGTGRAVSAIERFLGCA